MRLALTAVLLLVIVSQPAIAAWQQDGPLARAAPSSDLALYVGFYGPRCRPRVIVGKPLDPQTDARTLWVPVGELQISVDDRPISTGEQAVGQPLPLAGPAVDALRRGRIATVLLAGERLAFDLSGSARAIRAAEEQCRHPKPVGGWITIRDEITEGWAQRTIARIRDAKAVGLVLESTGGLVYEAEKLGRWVRAQGLDTAVRAECASACVNAWAGGVNRYIARGAKIGLHRARAQYAGYEDGQADVAAFATYLRSMEIAAADAIAVRAASTPSAKMDWVDAEEARSLSLATAIGEPPPVTERVAVMSPPEIVMGPVASAVPTPAGHGAVWSLIGIGTLVGVLGALGMAARRRKRHVPS